MAIQFLEEIARFFAGQLGEGPHRRTGSRRTTVDAPAGVFCVFTDNETCAPPTTAAQVEAGKGGVLEYLVDRIANANGLEYEADTMVRMVRWGFITVKTEEAVSDQDPVYVRYAAKGGNTQLGAARTDNDGDSQALILTNTITADTTITLNLDNETFVVATGASGNATTIAGVIQSAIDASAAFVAVDNADGTVTVTRVDGAVPGAADLELPDGITAAEDAAAAAKWPNAVFFGDATTGVAMVELS